MSNEDFRKQKPQTRDLSQYFDSMADWVKTNIAPIGQSRLTKLEPTSEDANGFVGESFIIEIEHDEDGSTRAQRYLLKRMPTKHIFFTQHDFAAEYLTQQYIYQNKLAPVAPFVGCHAGTDVLGSPFYIIGFVEGRPTPDKPPHYQDGWLHDASPEDQRKTALSCLGALAKLHHKTLDELDMPWLDRAAPGQTPLEWDLAKWDTFAEVSWLEGPLPVAVEARKWLENNKPTPAKKVISWGDARPGNMLFNGTQCNAIIDWDMVTAGDPEQDLGYWLQMDLSFQRFSEMANGPSSLPGWPSRKEMVDIYEEALGRNVDRMRLRYHRIFAAWQSAIMFARFNTMLNQDKYHEYVSEKIAPPLQTLREELALAKESGDVN